MRRLVRSRAAAAMVVVTIALLGAGCGDDEDSGGDSDTSSETTSGAGDPGDAGDSGNTGDSSDSDRPSPDAIGIALSSAFREATGYEVVDGVVRVTFENQTAADFGEAHCMTANSVSQGVPVVLVYPDGEVDCRDFA